MKTFFVRWEELPSASLQRKIRGDTWAIEINGQVLYGGDREDFYDEYLYEREIKTYFKKVDY